MPGDTIFNSGRSYWGANLTIAILNGSVPEWRLDDAATRILAAWYHVGRDKNTVELNFNTWSLDTFGYQNAAAEARYGLINQHVDVRGDHAQSIRNQAAKSTVLLKNSGVLPLKGTEKFTAIFGEDADTNLQGPNGCSDRGCDNGTLAIGWGSGTGNFPYLVSPLAAIEYELVSKGLVVQSVTQNWASSQISALARQAQQVAGVSIVFVNADSGEGYINYDGNEGDRQNLTLWKNGEALIRNVTAEHNNTVVVIHSVGPVIVADWHSNPNVTAIVWAGLPGEQSGNSIADILYGRVNPGGKLPFSLGVLSHDYGAPLLYTPNNGNNAPQVNFDEGVFIDYRSFDKKKIVPLYEFGFGLSYTSFSYSNINVQRHNVSAYTPTTGTTKPAPVLGNSSTDPADYQVPNNFTVLPLYIYPYLNSTNLNSSYGGSDYGSNDFIPKGAQDGSAQPRIAAGGAPGGNPQLYDVLFTVTATITNNGTLPGEEVPQLYINRGGPNDPKVELRNFDRLSIQPGQSATFTADVTRRDVSNWDPASQNWVITNYTKTVYVGSSSRKLPLSARLTF